MDSEELKKILELHKNWFKTGEGKKANLHCADLSLADLEGATYGDGIFIGDNPIQISGLEWWVFIMQDHIKIGCELHSKDEWKNFTDEEISDMDENALEFWKENKTKILTIADVYLF